MAAWILKEVNHEKVLQLVREYGIPRLAAEILLRRGIEDIDSFLNPDISLLNDPFLIKDIDKAVDILISSWKKKEPILIHGDYDVDGVTGSALLYSFMNKKGWNVDVYIPDRMNDGYGVSSSTIEEYFKKGFKVLLTVDCGTTAHESVKLAKNLGMKVVITDHHKVVGELPPADAVVNPHRPDDLYPFKDLAGVGVAFKLVQALADRFGMEFEDIEDLLDLVALGTVADMVTLKDENRFLVKRGMKKIGKTRAGLKKLLEKLSIKEVRSRNISYKIAPRLNAAGRMGTAYDAFKLLISKDGKEAEEMVKVLSNHNLLRQSIETDIFKEAIKCVERSKILSDPIILVDGDNWHVGVIGIVASRIANKYKRPAMVVSFNGEIGKGSARSYNGINILNIFRKFEDLFLEFGGHSMAVGFTIEKDKFEYLKKMVKNVELTQEKEKIFIDAEIELEDINPELFEVIDLFEPFGLGNPPLMFLTRNLDVHKVSFFEGGNSAYLLLRKGKRKLGALWHGMDDDSRVILKQGVVRMDVVGEIEPDFISPKIKVVDVAFKTGIDEFDEIKEPNVMEVLDKEEVINNKRVRELLWEEYDGGAIFSNIRSRNAILRKILEFDNSAVVVGCCKQIVEHVYESLLRHIEIDRDKFLTVKEFIENEAQPGMVVLVEPQILSILRDIYEIEEFIKVIARMRKVAIGIKMPGDVKKLLKEMRFQKLRAKFKKVDIRVQDMRDKEYMLNGKNNVVVSRRPQETAKFTNGQYYSHEINKFQRVSIVNLIKRGNIKKFSTSFNTDGLPTFADGGEVVVYDKPKTLYEIMDAIYPILNESRPNFIVNYSESHDEESIYKHYKS
ncbi:MAG: single-stranded-DNA-specific exonuclease RecJ, partial [Thermotogaceae bacterium]|nr:single-stranded-DNA-specific exonuclease RecJ [Thermotogaceae bacterium]